MLRKLLNRVKMARTVYQLEKITKEAFDCLSQDECLQVEQAVQTKIHKEPIRLK